MATIVRTLSFPSLYSYPTFEHRPLDPIWSALHKKEDRFDLTSLSPEIQDLVVTIIDAYRKNHVELFCQTAILLHQIIKNPFDGHEELIETFLSNAVKTKEHVSACRQMLVPTWEGSRRFDPARVILHWIDWCNQHK